MRFQPTHLVGKSLVVVGTCRQWDTANPDTASVYQGRTPSWDDLLEMAWAARKQFECKDLLGKCAYRAGTDHAGLAFAKYQSGSSVLGGYGFIDDPVISGHIAVKIGRQRAIFHDKDLAKYLKFTYDGCTYKRASAISLYAKVTVANLNVSDAKTQSAQRLGAAAILYYGRSKHKMQDMSCCSKLGAQTSTVIEYAGHVNWRRLGGRKVCIVEFGFDMQHIKNNQFWTKKDGVGEGFIKGWSSAMRNVRLVV